MIKFSSNLHTCDVCTFQSASEQVASISSDGIMRFTVDATDANAAKFVECIENVIGRRLTGVEVTDNQPPVS